ncbi:MAG TPA: DNA-formamidopyrimidine glycosylase, partial [Alphaproteobacteria bacterium]|nr:DNA-formamidopyrimidine glycosylase [Alphaproteobacteria bacterium]
MPELPEVETVRRGLAPVLEGQRLVRVEARRPDLRFPLPDGFAARLTGRQIGALRRRAKYLIAELDNDERLLMHLGMSGRFSVQGRAVGQFHHGMPGSEGGFGLHDHIVLETQSGTRIVYSDHRRFGMMDLYREDTGHRLLNALGPEPLTRGFTARTLVKAFTA